MNVDLFIPPPGHPLRPYLQSIWRMHARSGYAAETILPKGNVDILFNLCEPLQIHCAVDGVARSIPGGAYLAGMQTRALTSMPQGEVLLLGISFKAETCAPLLPLPLHELTDQTLEGGLVVKEVESLRQQLGEIADFDSQVQLLVQWLLGRIRSMEAGRLIDHACTWLMQAPADAGVSTLARSLGYSTRHLRRLFLQHVGVTPGHYMRLSRFIKSLHLMPSGQSLTEIAHAVSYFDQAHFCRDFKEIAGITPGEYREKAGFVVGHLFTP
jgi:AraC-like DNA-binding protein